MALKDMYALGQERAEELTRRLASCEDVKAAQAQGACWLDEIGALYVGQPLEAPRRRRALGLIALAKAALEVMDAADRAQVVLLPGPAPRRKEQGWRQMIRHLPALLAAVAAVWAFLTDQTNLCLLCALSAMGGYLAVQRGAQPQAVPQEQWQARPQVDAARMARRLGYLLREIDAQLQREDEAIAAPQDAPRLTAPMLESVQMLLEAQLTGDAQYALKGVSPLADAMARQGIEFVPYCPERARDFDLLPAPVGGETIRPAVRQGDTLLLRGQATVKK